MAADKPKSTKPKLKTGMLILRFAQLLFLLVIATLFLGAGVAMGFVASVLKDQPVLTYDNIKEKIDELKSATSFVYFNDGTLIGRLPTPKDQRTVPLDDISPYVIDALISTEDKNFFRHPGISLRGTARAVWQQLTGSDVQTGGSTITQQLVKQTLLSDIYAQEISGNLQGDALKRLKYRRKLNEILFALRVERLMTKEQILEAYLNTMYFGKSRSGSNLYGIQAAAQGYFDKDAKDLNLPEAAYLVGMLQGPGNYLPYPADGETYQAGLRRMQLVLNEMKKDGKINDDEYQNALTYDIADHVVANSDSDNLYNKAEYRYLYHEVEKRAVQALVEQDLRARGIDPDHLGTPEDQKLEAELRSRYQRDLSTKGYHIYTTIDKTLYEAFQAVAKNDNNFWTNPPSYTAAGGKKIEKPYQQVGAVLVDNRTGAILAFLDGRDYDQRPKNFADNPRSPGSSIKPILAYAPAFEEGVLLSPDVMLDDTPLVLDTGQGEFAPANWDNKFHGLRPAREMLAKSYNIPALKLSYKVGLPKALDYARRMGLKHIVQEDLQAQTAAIGGLTHGATVYEMTQAFTVFANGGKLIENYMIEKITDDAGNVIYQHESKPVPVLSPETAYLMTDMLTSVLNMPGATGAGIRAAVEKAHGKRAMAGKTGTSNHNEDSWFVGYTPTLTLGVWMGFEDRLPDDSKLTFKPTRSATTFWPLLMNKVLELKPELSPKDAVFQKPGGIVSLSACTMSGKLPNDACREAGWVQTMMFNKKYVPTETDDLVQKARIVVVNDKNYIALDQTPDDLAMEKILVKREPYRVPKNPRSGVNYTVPDRDLTLPAELDPRQEDGATPSAPKGLSASYDAATQTVTLTWTPNPEGDIAGYRIYRNHLLGMERVASIMSHLPTTFSEKLSDPFAVYTVTAVDIVGHESPPSESVSPYGGPPDAHMAPNPPKGLKATFTDTGVVLTWNPNPEREGVVRYHIYYSDQKDGPFEELGTADGPYFQYLTFNDGGYYAVSAENALGESKLSKPVSPKPESQSNKPDQGAGDRGENGTPANPPEPPGGAPGTLPITPPSDGNDTTPPNPRQSGQTDSIIKAVAKQKPGKPKKP